MDFVQILPYDVLCQIFTAHPYSNEDCLEFVKVCRSWRSAVPGYTTMIWRRAHFSGCTWARTDIHMARFLGHHVREVSLEDFAKDKVTIVQALEMLTRAECFHIEKLVFRQCGFAMDHRLLSYIRRLGKSKLIELAFIQHMANLPFNKTITACPQLRRFFYSVDMEQSIDYSDICAREPVIQDGSEIDEDAVLVNMACLSIDVPISYSARLRSILKKCPNLRVLRAGDTDINCDLVSGTIINITDIFRWCPYLDYLECNNLCRHPLHKQAWWTADHRRLDYEQYGGLRDFVYYEGFQQEESFDALRLITRNQKSLQSLTIGRNDFSHALQWNPLGKLKFPQLQSLKLHEAYIKEQDLAALIAHCPSLEEVYLDTYPLVEFYLSVFDALQALSHLRELTVDYKFAGDPLHGGGWESDRRFEMFIPLCDYLEAVTNNGFQRLHVNFNHVADVLHSRFLLSVASVSSIQTFALCNRVEPDGTDDISVTQNDVIAFMHKLKANTQIRTLTFAQMDFLYSSAFSALGELEHLTGLLFNNCASFTAQDVLTLLKRTESLEHLIIIDNKAKIWTDLPAFVSQINSSTEQCSYTAVQVNPNQVLIRIADCLAVRENVRI